MNPLPFDAAMPKEQAHKIAANVQGQKFGQSVRTALSVLTRSSAELTASWESDPEAMMAAVDMASEARELAESLAGLADSAFARLMVTAEAAGVVELAQDDA